MSWIPVWVGLVRPHRLFGSLALWMWLVSAIKWTNEGYKTIRLGFLSFPFVSFLHVAPVRFLLGFFWPFLGLFLDFFFFRISILFIIIYVCVCECVCGWVGGYFLFGPGLVTLFVCTFPMQSVLYPFCVGRNAEGYWVWHSGARIYAHVGFLGVPILPLGVYIPPTLVWARPFMCPVYVIADISF